MVFFIKLILRNGTERHQLRSGLTATGIVVTIVAFGMLSTLVDAWYAGVEESSAYAARHPQCDLASLFSKPGEFLVQFHDLPHDHQAWRADGLIFNDKRKGAQGPGPDPLVGGGALLDQGHGCHGRQAVIDERAAKNIQAMQPHVNSDRLLGLH
jgi:hypothetical protein